MGQFSLVSDLTDIVTRWIEDIAVASALYTLIEIGAFEKFLLMELSMHSVWRQM